MELITLISIGAVVLFLLIVSILRMYKRCPSDKALVVFGKTGSNSTSKIIHGGGIFIIPVFQDYSLLSLEPRQIKVNLTDALSKQDIRIVIESTFTYAISTEADSLRIAAERFLSMPIEKIDVMVHELISGQLRSIASSMTIEEINSDRLTLSEHINKNVESELSKIGLKLVVEATINDIRDEGGYIEAKAKQAHSTVVNAAMVSVAEQDRIGAIGVATQKTAKEIEVSKQISLQSISVANNETEGEIGVARANAERVKQVEISRVIEGTALAKATEEIAIANTEAKRNTEIAKSNASAQEYEAQAQAQAKRADMLMAQAQADEIVKTKIETEKIIIEAEAQAKAEILKAQAQAEAIISVAKAKAEAVEFEMLAQAKGIKEIMDSSGGDSNVATSILMLDKISEIYKMQTEAVGKIKIDKVTVWDNGKGNGVGNVVGDIMSAVPPLADILSGQGMSMPSFLGTENPITPSTVIESKENGSNTTKPRKAVKSSSKPQNDTEVEGIDSVEE